MLKEVLESSPEDRVAILEEWGRTPETVKKDIEQVKEWLKKQPQIPYIPSTGSGFCLNEKTEVLLF